MQRIPAEHIHEFDNSAAMKRALLDQLEIWFQQEDARSVVVLAPDEQAAFRYRRAFAGEPSAFGVTFTTLSAWLKDVWGLFGDGTVPIDATHRLATLQALLSEADNADAERHLHPTPGTVRLLADVAREAFSLFSSESMTAREVDCSAFEPAEVEALSILDSYGCRIRSQGWCEETEIMEGLLSFAHAESWQLARILLVGFDDLTIAQESFFAGLAETASVEWLVDATRADRESNNRAVELSCLQNALFGRGRQTVAPTGALTFLFPSGPSARIRAIDGAVCKLSEECEGDIVVACRDVARTYDSGLRIVDEEGRSSSAAISEPFGQTSFGRALSSLASLLSGDDWTTAMASDFANSHFSHISSHRAAKLDIQWRGNRLVTVDECIDDMRAASEFCEQLLPLFLTNRYVDALDLLIEDISHRSDTTERFRIEQMAAMHIARRTADAALACGISLMELMPLLESETVSFQLCTQPKMPSGKGEVRFTSLEAAARGECASCDALLLCDMESTSYPVRQNDDAGALLLGKAGIGKLDSPLEASRRRLFRAILSAKKRVICERVLTTWDVGDAYPAQMLEEMIACYRPDPTVDDLDRLLGLPDNLLEYAAIVGEDDLFANAIGIDGEQAIACEEQIAPLGIVDARSRALINVDRQDSRGAPLPGLSLSPSAIESFLECPYKWFALRRFRLKELDAELDSMTMGSFAHGVLCSFYRHFSESGHAKVTQDNLPEAKALLEEIFSRHLDEQSRKKPKDHPLVAIGEAENARIEDLRKQLVGYLERDVILLPSFAPHKLELGFGRKEKAPFEYAGCYLNGTIDRLDIDGDGKAVVIDYKGSVDDDFLAGSATPIAEGGFALPHKMQTLIYAQYVRREMGLDVVGALYVSYGRKEGTAGALASQIEHDVPAMAVEKGLIGPGGGFFAGSFSEYLDATEEAVASALESMRAGNIEPSPRFDNACKHCPAQGCAQRRCS